MYVSWKPDLLNEAIFTFKTYSDMFMWLTQFSTEQKCFFALHTLWYYKNHINK